MTRMLCWVLIVMMSGLPAPLWANDCNDKCCMTDSSGNGNDDPASCGEDDECEDEENQIDSDDDPVSASRGMTFGSSKGFRPVPQRGGRKSAALAFGRFYASDMKSSVGGPSYSGPLGVGMTHNYNVRLMVMHDAVAGDSALITTWNGSQLYFRPGFIPSHNFGSTLTHTGTNYIWQLRRGTKYYFQNSSLPSKIEDRIGNYVTLAYHAFWQLTNVTDHAGRSLSFSYDASGFLTNVTDPLNRFTSFSYDESGQLTNETDSAGLKFAYQYDPSTTGKVVAVTDGRGNVMVQYGYDEIGSKVIAETNALGYVQTFDYDDPNRTATIVNRNGYTYTDYFDEYRRIIRRDNWAGTKEYERDGDGHITNIVDRLGSHWHYEFNPNACGCGLGAGKVRSEDPLNRINQWAYQSSYNQRTAFTNAAGKVTRWTYDNKGNLTNTTDALSHVTHYRYDTLGNRTNITDALGRATRFAYDYYGNLSNTVNALNQTTIYRHDIVGRLTNHVDALNRWTDYTYDARDRLVRQVNSISTNAWAFDGNGNKTAWTNALSQVTGYTYDTANQLRSVTLPSGGVPVARYGYDGNGNRIAATNALGHVTSYGYDGADRLVAITNALEKVWTFEYDAEGRRTASSDPENHTTLFGYDAAGQLTSITNALDQTIQFQYDVVGNRTNIIDGRGNLLGFAYDAVNRLTNIIYAANDKERFQYDAVGNVTNFINRAGQSIRFTYDAANRLTSKFDVAAGSVTTQFQYDDVGQITRAHVYDIVPDTLSDVTFAYDANGRLTNETQAFWPDMGGFTATVGYEYDAAGRRTKLIYPDGSFVTYKYNANGWLTNISDGGTTTIVSYEYDSAGRRTKRTLQNSTFTVLEYDNASQLTNIWHRQVGGGSTNTLSCYRYGYDDAEKRRWVKRANDKGDVYQYDATDQLTNVLYEATNPDGTPSGASSNIAYFFDPAGNRTNVTSSVSGTTVYIPNPLNQYTNVGGTRFTYDANGNLIGDGSWAFGYDTENHLSSAYRWPSYISYYYDAFGRLAARAGPLMVYVYDGWQLIAEYLIEEGAHLQAKYVYGPGIDEPVRMTRNGNNYFYHQAALNTVTEISDANGNVVEQYSYDVYGAPTFKNSGGGVISGSAIGNRLLFQGRDRDPHTGLYNYRYRYYSPSLGRFVQTDPIITVRTPNLYAFVGNDPVNYFDPFGLFALDEDGFPIMPTGTAMDSYAYDDETRDRMNEIDEAGDEALKEGAKELAMALCPIGRVAKLGKPLASLAKKLGRPQVFLKFPTRKAAKDAAAHSPGGPWQKNGKTMGPEKHGNGLPHYHDGWHDNLKKPNNHYQFPNSQY